MNEPFVMKLDKIQPSQLYVSSKKLAEVMKAFAPIELETLGPIPVKKLAGEVIFTDGHTRAFAAFLRNLQEIRVVWEDEELDWEAYEICVEWCKKEGIFTIADLKNRVISQEEYDVLWLRRCEKMQRDLENRRKRK